MNRRHPLPMHVYELVEQTPGAVLLESASASGPVSVSRLFLDPVEILTASDARGLDALFERTEAAVDRGRFAAGYFTYECGACFEPKARSRPAGLAQSLAWFGIYDRCHAFDHTEGAFSDGEPAELRDAVASIEPVSGKVVDVRMDIGEDDYTSRIFAIHEFIRAGDVYQLNFTFPLRFNVEGSAAGLYAALRERQPVDHGAFLHCDTGHRILSLSPELFFCIDGSADSRRILTRPMKGTAPRGRTTEEDRAMAEWLRNDPKNRSENVMIVDLLRNDLGRLCEFGSVRVDELFSVERYPSLWQMTSTVSGSLRANVNYRDIFRALFPSGSVTGAPKVRAMQLLGQLEAEPRGVYTGAIGFFSREAAEFNVAIRTLELDGTAGRMGVGSGIVIDSVPADEFRECALKASFLTSAAEPFKLIETMLWDDGYPLLELHLDRLENSADYFGYPCDRTAVKSELQRTAERLEPRPHRVRLTLPADGEIRIEHRPLAGEELSEPLRVFIAAPCTDAANRFLFHKTTNRALYVDVWNAARRSGYIDALFLNHAGQVTEGAASNIFIERDGRWFTPLLECGVLPGVFRRHLLATRPEVEERILTLEDLKAADRVYISNAVGGLRQVLIDWDYIGPSWPG
jgi:para-aminobenzoate synthetase/4-amino-4-deoxychorismate lyase